MADDVCCLTFSGLSKAYRTPGYRAGWVAVTGPHAATLAYREGLELLASSACVPTSLPSTRFKPVSAGYQSIDALIRPGESCGNSVTER